MSTKRRRTGRRWEKTASGYMRADIDSYGSSQIVSVARAGSSCPFRLAYWDGQRTRSLGCFRSLKSAVKEGNKIFGR